MLLPPTVKSWRYLAPRLRSTVLWRHFLLRDVFWAWYDVTKLCWATWELGNVMTSYMMQGYSIDCSLQVCYKYFPFWLDICLDFCLEQKIINYSLYSAHWLSIRLLRNSQAVYIGWLSFVKDPWEGDQKCVRNLFFCIILTFLWIVTLWIVTLRIGSQFHNVFST